MFHAPRLGLALAALLLPDDAVLLRGAAVLTLDPGAPRAEAVLVVGETVAAVGSLEECRVAMPDGGREVWLSGGTLTRGFFDGHARATDGGRERLVLDLSAAADEREMLDLVKERAAAAAPGEWIVGYGFDETRWEERAWPLRSTLDRTTELNPSVVVRYDGRSALANTSALHQAGVDERTPDPEGGWFERDEDGVPTGVVHGTALERVLAAGPEPTFEERLDGARRALEEARAHGVTSLVDVGGDVEIWRTLRRQGELTARVHVGARLGVDLADRAALREALGTERRWIDLDALHATVDGTIDAGTAAVFEPWVDDASRPIEPRFAPPDLRERVVAADAAGFRVALHASGDRAVALALDLLEHAAAENGSERRRHRVERIELIRPADAPRFAALEVTASLLPALLVPALEAAPLRLGPDRTRRAFPWALLASAGAPLALGSGYPAAPLDPRRTLFAATTRASVADPFAAPLAPEQALPLGPALYAQTVGAARASFREEVLGPLEPGSWADLVWLDAPPEEIVGRRWLDVRMGLTMVAGKVVHRDG